MFIHSGRQLLLTGVVCLLAACGGGSDAPAPQATVTDPGPQLPATPTAETTLLSAIKSNGDLVLFDPATPAVAAVTVDTGLDPSDFFSFRQVTAATYVSSSHALADGHEAALVYVKDGKLWKVSLLRAADHDPVQVSTIADACALYGLLPDYANVDHTQVVVERVGLGTDCNSASGLALARLDMDSGDAPLSLSWDQYPAGILLGSDGSLAAVLAHDYTNNVLRRYDANLQNPVTIANLEPGTYVYGHGAQVNRTTPYWIAHLKDELSACLYRLDLATNTFSACLQPMPDPSAMSLPFSLLSDADGTHAYFSDGETLFRVGHTATSAETLVAAAANVEVQGVWLSSGRTIVRRLDNNTGTFSIYAHARNGSGGNSLYSGSDYAAVQAVAGSRAYLTVYGASQTALLALEDGTVASYQDAGWGGASYSTTSAPLGKNAYLAPYHLAFGQADVNYNVTIKSFDAQAGTVLHTLGVIPFASDSFSFSWGRHRLAEITIYRPPYYTAYDTDVFFFDTAAANSMRSVATTVGGNDRITF